MSERFARGWMPEVAGWQAGLFTARQAADAGMTPAQIRHRRDSGQWERVVGDAFALATLPRDPWALAHGAALTWPDGVVCLASAAGVQRLPVRPTPDVHVIMPNRRASR